MMTMTELRSQRKRNGVSMADVRFYNQRNGQHFFSRNNMRFFASRVESSLLSGDYFITSEKAGFVSNKRVYTARQVSDDFSVVTLSPCRLHSKEGAMGVIREHRQQIANA